MTRRRAIHLRSGFFLTDLVVGIGILVILTLVLTTAAAQYRRGSQKLADSRQAVRLAEQVMLSLQSDQKPPAAADGDNIDIVPLPETRGLPQGCVWIRVQTRHSGHTAELIGVVKSDAIKGARP